MVLPLRSVLQELDRLSSAAEVRTIDDIGREEIVASVARAALLGARGNSGVILSQLIRGAAEELASRPGELVDPVLISAALARASDQAYGSVREPAEGTILTVVREMAVRVASEIAHMDDARLGPEASAAEQNAVIAEVIERALAVGDPSTLKVHVHTDEPDAATAVFAGAGAISHLVVADMREQVEQREQRLAAPDPAAVCGAVAVSTGEGMRELFAGLGLAVLDGGP